MSSGFEALSKDIIEEKQIIEESSSKSPLLFLREFYERYDTFLLSVLSSLEGFCDDEEKQPDGKEDELKSKLYRQLQTVRERREALHSGDVPTDLYFFLEDVKTDLSLELDIGLEAGNVIRIYRLREQFQVLQHIAFWEEVVDQTDARVITFPRSELRKPLSYCLIVHECFHTKTDLIEDVRERVADFDEEIPVKEEEEVIVDLLSLNYLGPVYGHAIANIPNKIGRHESTEHPSVETRLGYILEYINIISTSSSASESDPTSAAEDDRIQQELDIDDGYHPVFGKIQSSVREEMEAKRVSGEEDYEISSFNEIQEIIVSEMDKRGIPTYEKERGEISRYLGMPKAKDSVIGSKLDKFILDSARGQEIALPVKPILLFNLLIVAEDPEESELREVSLESFKKWFVTRKTKVEKGAW